MHVFYYHKLLFLSFKKCIIALIIGFPGGSHGKESACSAGDLGWEDPLEKGMAPHSSILGWRIPWTEQPGGLQSMGLQELTQLIEEHFHFKGDTL